jgi:hypothetical protein
MSDLPNLGQGHQVLPDTNVLNWVSADGSGLCSSTLTALCSHTRDHNGDHEAIKADGTVRYPDLAEVLRHQAAEIERLTARRQAELDELKAKCGKQADMLAYHCKTRDEVLNLLDRFNTVPADDVIAEQIIDSARNLLAGGAR